MFVGHGLSPVIDRSYPRSDRQFVRRGLKALYTMELERRNLLQYSEDFTKSAWTIARGSVTAYAEATPAGQNLATRLVEDIDTGDHYAFQDTPSGLVENEDVWLSVYAKAAERTRIQLVVRTFNTTFPAATFDLVAGAVADISPSVLDTAIESVGNGWYRCALKANTLSGADAGSLQIRLVSNGTTTNYTGDGSSGLLIYGAMLTPGALLPYTPTTNKQALYDYSGQGNDAYLGSAGSAFIQPVQKYLSLPGNGYALTPDSAANSITGDVDLRAKVALASVSSVPSQGLVGKWGGAGNSYYLYLPGGSVGTLGMAFDNGAIVTAASTVTLASAGIAAGDVVWLRVTRDASSGAVTFYWGTDGENWTPLGDVVSKSVGAMSDRTTGIGVGGKSDGAEPLNGRIYRAQVYDGIDGTLAVDFNPEDAHGDVSQFYSQATGELWTVNQASYADTNDPAWTGEGFTIDGVDDAAILPYSVDGAADFTATIISHLPSDPTDFRRFFSDDGSGATYWTLVTYPDDQLRWEFRDGTNSGATAGVTRRSEPMMLTAALDRGIGKVRSYDGATRLSDYTAPPGTVQGGTGIRIGWASLGVEGEFSLSALYGVALTDAEIAQNYRAAQHLLAQRGVTI